MTEEEKKAIILLNDFKEGKIERDKLEHYSKGGFKLGYFYTLDIQKSIDIILNLLEKQQKEIEEKDKRIFYLENELRKEVNQELDKAKVDLYKNYVPKEAIREKIKELSDNKDFDEDVYVEEYAVDVLKELLGE